MTLTGKQEHVLSNLHRVEKLPYKIIARGRKPRYQLDGWECTTQISSLGAKGIISKTANGSYLKAATGLHRST